MIVKNLRSVRNNLNLLQKEVAIKMGISESTYSHFESGDQIIPIIRLISFSDIFNVSLDYIFGFSTIQLYDNNRLEIDSKIAGERLKEFRKEKGITLKDLGNILNCSYGTIAGYESGRYLIATPFLYEICQKYNVSADYLLGKIDKPKYLK